MSLDLTLSFHNHPGSFSTINLKMKNEHFHPIRQKSILRVYGSLLSLWAFQWHGRTDYSNNAKFTETIGFLNNSESADCFCDVFSFLPSFSMFGFFIRKVHLLSCESQPQEELLQSNKNLTSVGQSASAGYALSLYCAFDRHSNLNRIGLNSVCVGSEITHVSQHRNLDIY